MSKRAAIYVRVSTDKQTVGNQVAVLRQIAKRRGWEVVGSRKGFAGLLGDDRLVVLRPEMVEHFGLDVVHAYMRHVQDNAEEAVRRVIGALRDGD